MGTVPVVNKRSGPHGASRTGHCAGATAVSHRAVQRAVHCHARVAHCKPDSLPPVRQGRLRLRSARYVPTHPRRRQGRPMVLSTVSHNLQPAARLSALAPRRYAARGGARCGAARTPRRGGGSEPTSLLRSKPTPSRSESAVRWVHRRARLVHAGLRSIIGLLPEVLAGIEPTVTAVRLHLNLLPVLGLVREIAAAHLHALPPPLGFGPRPQRRWSRPEHLQQSMGPDPP